MRRNRIEKDSTFTTVKIFFLGVRNEKKRKEKNEKNDKEKKRKENKNNKKSALCMYELRIVESDEKNRKCQLQEEEGKS